MALIKSISGIRGTIGGKTGDNLTPIDLVKFATAYADWLIKQGGSSPKVIIGRDARISGEIVQQLVSYTLVSKGINVVDIGLSTTPTVEMVVPYEKANGGIILTASHNPKEWNALKLLNHKGEFLSANDGKGILEAAEEGYFNYNEVGDLGKVNYNSAYIDWHIEQVIKHELVDKKAVKSANLKVVVDAVNSTGGISIPPLLRQLGVQVIPLYCEPNGDFPHNPEPLKKHLKDISNLVKEKKADLGIVVDPDVDRLAIIDEHGEMIGEEYTLVSVADYVLAHKPGSCVSNLSSSRALQDIAKKHNCDYHASAVGEVNVVEKMKETKAVIGGEGNGGIIMPDLHYGRDSLIGTALFLTHLVHSNLSCSKLRASLPDYFMAKEKVQLTPNIDVDDILSQMQKDYAHEDHTTIDGLKIDFADSWVHFRKSNTESIIRVYTEAKSQEVADILAQNVIKKIRGKL